MRRSGALCALAVALFLFVVAGCGSGAATLPSTAAATAAGPSSPLVGIITAVDSKGLGDVRGFTLRAPEGQQYQIAIGTLENGASFPPGHLAEHLATAEPVRVYFRQGSSGLVAYRIEDAGAAASPSDGESASPS